jgi:hypothetical protein
MLIVEPIPVEEGDDIGGAPLSVGLLDSLSASVSDDAFESGSSGSDVDDSEAAVGLDGAGADVESPAADDSDAVANGLAAIGACVEEKDAVDAVAEVVEAAAAAAAAADADGTVNGVPMPEDV